MVRRLVILLFGLFSIAAYAQFTMIALHSTTPPDAQGGGPSLRAQNIFGSPISVTPQNYYIPGTGNPAISTSDYYHMNGLYWWRPHDLTQSDCGSVGASIAAANGRYAWFAGPDHADTHYTWGDGQDFYLGFSNDPGVLPTSIVSVIRFNNNIAVGPGGQVDFFIDQNPYLVCNPDDATFPFYLFAVGGGINVHHEEGLARSADLFNWTMFGGTHLNPAFANESSYQRVVRTGANAWYSTGEKVGYTPNLFVMGKWTSTNGTSFSPVNGFINTCIPASSDGALPCVGVSSNVILGNAPDSTNVGGQAYTIGLEDARNNVGGGMFVTRAPIDANFNILNSPAAVRVSTAYSGVFPGPGFLQNVGAIVEDGVAHYYALHGFFPSSSVSGTVDAATYANGGGLWQENIDYYTEIIDATAAASAAPIGVTASCAGGVATLTWYNALPNNTYRVYRGTSVGSQPTNLGAATAPTFSNTPGSANQFFYKVVTLNGGTETGSRIVNVYCTSANVRVNAHINRVLNDGGDITKIDQMWLAATDNWLVNTCNCYSNLRLWTNPAFGVKISAGLVTKVYDYGTTKLPRGGDLMPCANSLCNATASTTYSATGLNSTTPAWVNGTLSSFSYYGNGRFNNIQRQVQITTIAAFSNSGSCHMMATGENNPIALGSIAGNVSFSLADEVQTQTATIALSGSAAHIVGGTFDGTSLKAWSEGTAGTAQTGLHANTDLSLPTALRGTWEARESQIRLLQSGAIGSKYIYGANGAQGTYVFDDNHACGAISDLAMFDVALSSSQMLSLTGPSGLLRTRIGP